MTEVATLKKTIQQLVSQKKYVWSHYFNMRNHFFRHTCEQQQRIQKIVDMIDEMNEDEIPSNFKNLIASITDIAIKNDEFLKCSICLSVLQNDTITSSKCGHLYCVTCLNKLKPTKKCAVCRQTL
jgi:hypothetical protein